MKAERNLHVDVKSNGLTHEEAKRRLDEVRRRLGIHLEGSQERPVANTPPIAPKERVRLKVEIARSAPETGLEPANRKQSAPTSKNAEAHPASESPTEKQSFHFLIRIAECTSVLHCEVKAGNAAAARDRVQRIPNLMEWQEVSFLELVEADRKAALG